MFKNNTLPVVTPLTLYSAIALIKPRQWSTELFAQSVTRGAYVDYANTTRAGDYLTLGLRGQINLGDWELHAEARNLTDERYASTVIGASLNTLGADSVSFAPGEPQSFTVGATYSTGRDASTAGNPGGTNCGGENAADKKACREWSTLLKYDSPSWGAALAVDEIRGGAGSWAPAGLISSDLTDRRISLGAYAKVAGVKLGAGLLSRDNDGSGALKKDGTAAKRSDMWYVGAAYPVTPKVTVDGQVFHLKYKDSANKSLMFALRGTYALSKRTAVYATAGSIDNSGTQNLSVSNAAAGGTTVAGGNQIGLATGIRHSF